MASLSERRVAPLAEWARKVSGFSLVLFVTAGIGHRYGQIETVAFFWILGLVAVLALAGLALAAGGFTRLWRYGERAGRASLAATLLSAAVLAPFVAGAWFVLRYPALTDISTDLIEPPQFLAAARARVAGMNPIVPIVPEAAQAQLAHYPQVSGRRYEASIERVLGAVRATVAAHGWKPYPARPAPAEAAELSIEVEAPTFLLRFPADAVLRLTDEGDSVFVDMRMNARYGRHDMGDNARRIRGFMAALDAEFTRQALEIIDIPPPSGEEEDPVD